MLGNVLLAVVVLVSIGTVLSLIAGVYRFVRSRIFKKSRTTALDRFFDFLR